MRILSMGIKEYDRSKIYGVVRTELNKPWGGVLWGSTLERLPGGLITSSWNRYVNGNFEAKDFKYGISFKLHKNSKILEINSTHAYIMYMNKYKTYDAIGQCELDFTRISQDYDAFHLTEDAFWELRLPMESVIYNLGYGTFYSYDAESWVIFNPDCINEGSIQYHNNIEKFL